MNNRISRQEEKAPAPHRTILRVAAVVFIALGLWTLLNIVILGGLLLTHNMPVPLVSGHPFGLADYIENVIVAAVMLGGGALLYYVAPRMME